MNIPTNKVRVYVAGPISKGCLRHNLEQARVAGRQLMKAGFAPFVPHLTAFMGSNTPEALPNGTTPEDWYGADLPWVGVSQALLRLPGESVGADLEVAHAKKNDVPVFYTVDGLLAYFGRAVA